MTPDLFIGITSWNSALFLPHCLEAIRATTAGVATKVVVLDNCSVIPRKNADNGACSCRPLPLGSRSKALNFELGSVKWRYLQMIVAS